MTPELKHAVEADVERVQTALAAVGRGVRRTSTSPSAARAPSASFGRLVPPGSPGQGGGRPGDVIRSNHPVA